MDRHLKNALHKIRAEDALLERTASRLSAEIRRHRRRKPARFHLATACASLLVLLALGGFSLNLYLTPSAYIDMDVNPSLELTTNRFGRVILEQSYNGDGARILSEVSVRNLCYVDALDRLIDAMKRDGYLDQDALVSVTVRADDGTLLQDVRACVNAALQGRHLTAETDVFAVTQDVKTISAEHHLSPARYLAITQLQQVDPEATIAGCRNHSISDLRHLARGHASGHEAEHEQDPDPPVPAVGHLQTSTSAPTPQSANDHGERARQHNGHSSDHH